MTDEDTPLHVFDAQTYRVFLIDEVARLAQPGTAQAAWVIAERVGAEELMMRLDDSVMALSMAVPDEITPAAERSIRNSTPISWRFPQSATEPLPVKPLPTSLRPMSGSTFANSGPKQ